MKYLLHACCGPCSTACIESLLKDNIRPILFFDNPNIYDEAEREKRRENLHIVATHYGLEAIDGFTPHEEWKDFVKGLENEKEGGERCKKCFYFNALLASRLAEKIKADLFSTSLTVSRFKNSKKIFAEFSQFPNFDERDFKKCDGFAKSCQLAKNLNLYRQHFCGCEFSNPALTKILI